MAHKNCGSSIADHKSSALGETMATNYFSAFAKHQYMNLVTYRKSGEGVKTPVWFAQDGNRLVMLTQPAAGKLKRIRNNPCVQIAPSDVRGNPLGATIEAQARILSASEYKHAEQIISKKYSLVYAALRIQAKLRGQNMERVFIEITPPQGR
jgi:uncharacterized protein